jgi:hypothetical protein
MVEVAGQFKGPQEGPPSEIRLKISNWIFLKFNFNRLSSQKRKITIG